MKSTKREILIREIRNEIPDGHDLSDGVIEHIECFSAALEAMEIYANQCREEGRREIKTGLCKHSTTCALGYDCDKTGPDCEQYEPNPEGK